MNDEQRKLVEENIGLVGKTISVYYKQYMGDEDIYQIGCMGLIKGVVSYDKPDVNFSTYVVYWIRMAIYQHFKDIGRLKRKSNINTRSIFDSVMGTNDVKLYETITDDIDFSNSLVIDISLKLAFEKLDDMNKEILKLYLQGYSFREMSEHMHITHQGISSRFNRKIKPLLKEVVA